MATLIGPDEPALAATPRALTVLLAPLGLLGTAAKGVTPREDPEVLSASLDAVIQVRVIKGLGITTPLMQTATHWYTHGFGADLDEAMRGAAHQMLWLMQEHLGLSADDAYSLASVAIDLGVTQVVDGTLGCHAGLERSIVEA